MLTSTGRYISGNLTEQGRFAINNLTELGEYAPTDNPLYELIMSGGMVVGGELRIPCYLQMSGGVVIGGTFPLPTTSGMTIAGGILVGGTQIKKQMPFESVSPANTEFTLSDASINFKLEQQP